jgi:hypothetical protein
VSSDLFFPSGTCIARYRIPVRTSTSVPKRSPALCGPYTWSMQEVQSHIDIEAPASLVWAILADFGSYRRWNPLIRGVLGRTATGAEIEIRLRSPVGADVSVRSTVVRVREPRELRWLERWTMPGLFSSEHRFRIETLPEGGVRFHHGERVRGVMVPLLNRRRRLRGKPGFDAMNTALKQRAERAWANHAPATT